MNSDIPVVFLSFVDILFQHVWAMMIGALRMKAIKINRCRSLEPEPRPWI